MANRYLRTATGGLQPQHVISNGLQGACEAAGCWLALRKSGSRGPVELQLWLPAVTATASWQSQQTHQVIHQVNLKNLEHVTAQQRGITKAG